MCAGGRGQERHGAGRRVRVRFFFFDRFDGGWADVETRSFRIRKVLGLKLWEDEEGNPWRRSVKEIRGKVLFVSQFTLHGSVKKPRPSFHRAMAPDASKVVYQDLIKKAKTVLGEENILEGEFGAKMQVEIVNDGPVTLIIDSPSEDADKSAE